jgi:hypothetical protein
MRMRAGHLTISRATMRMLYVRSETTRDLPPGPSRPAYFLTYFDDPGTLFSYLLQWVSNSCSTGEPTR